MRRLLVPALLVYSVILFRAGHQAVTLDEADAYLSFAAGNLDMSFYPSSGNHVLHSLLTRYITQIFGLSQFTVRGASMLGAAIYLIAAAAIATRIADGSRKFQLLGFAILTLNPFVLDYLIASRGYALALGLLAAAVALAGEHRDWRRHALFSICCGLALAANFSFAFAIVSTVGAFVLTTREPVKRWIALAAATCIPGAVVALAIVGTTLRDYPRNQLYYGAETWTQTFKEMLDAVFPRENLSFPAVSPILSAIHPAGYLLLIPIIIAAWVAIRNPNWHIRFVWLALIFTMTAHGLAHAINNLLLPLDRTGLFLAFFLSILAVYAAAKAPIPQARLVATTTLCASLFVFVLAFRTNYFRIWDFDLDINKGFAALVEYSKNHKIDTAGATWRYIGTYKFYRAATNTNLPDADYVDQDNPPLRSVYFLNVPGQADFIAKEKLNIIYQGPISGLVVGTRP